MDNEFMDKIERIVERHPRLCYSIELEDSHIPYRPAEMDMFFSTFYGVWREYSQALFGSIRLMVRYEKSLVAWSQLVEEADSEIRDTLVIDYVQPVFGAVCDIPNAFKDQLVRAVVKLEHVAKGDDTFIAIDVEDGSRRPNWYGELKKGCSGNLAAEIRDVISNDLFERPDAKHFRIMHGSTVHDSSVNLVDGKASDIAIDSGVVIRTYQAPLDLKQELEVIDRQRKVIQSAYELFDAYTRELYAVSAGRL